MELSYMRRAIALAAQGRGRVNPNPLVGAVLVKDGVVIGEGYHEHYGGLHAERNAFASCGADPGGADLYVTLEPCCHYGKTPPCTQIILEKKIKRVFIGSRDPNPLVAGKGARLLREAGILVTEDVLREECDKLNPVFFHYITTGLPYVVMKYAMTADGKIAARTGDSKWITGEAARADVQRRRNELPAILAGIGTVLADDPLLTCRLAEGRNPLRLICDSRLRLPLDSKIAVTAREVPTIVATVCGDTKRIKALEALGIRVWVLPEQGGRVDLRAFLERLGREKIDAVLLEGGGELNEAMLREGLVNRVLAYVAPKLIGGRDAKSPVEGRGVDLAAQAYPLRLLDTCRMGADILLEYEFCK